MENNEILDDEIVPIEMQLDLQSAEKTEDDSEIGFEDLGLDEETLAAVSKKGFKVPSPIQVLAIPRLLNGDANIIARARTGTGKTAAFGLPIIQKVRGIQGQVKALVLEPTRELAIQTCTEFQSFTDGKNPRTCVLYGGASYSTQIKELKRGVEVVVGTPGRIQDHIERGTLDLSKIDYFILDEGDQMLDMGFVDDIEAIFGKANPNARILLFSATMPEPILKIAGKFMGDYEIVEEEGVVDEPLLIDQKFWVVKDCDKINALVRLIDIADDFYGIVFTQTKNDADFVTRILDEKGFDVAALHGDIAQAQREKIIARFRSKKTKILVATDVAARGIDISGLNHVVNYSLPFDGATYVHRIGRTGRAGSQGTAVTFVAPQETRKLGYMRRAVAKASKGEMKEEEIPTVEEVLAKKKTRIFSELKKSIGLSENAEENPSVENQDETSSSDSALSENEEAGANSQEKSGTDETAEKSTTTSLLKAEGKFEAFAEELCKNNDAKEVLAAVLSFIYKDKLDSSKYGKIQSHGKIADQVRLYIQLGRRDGYNPKGLADYFSKMLHIPGRMVDRIDISSNFSLVSLPKEAAKKALDLAKRNQNVPHMHVDTKDSFSGDFGGRRGSGRKRGGFGGGDFGGRRSSGKFYGGKDRNDRGDRSFSSRDRNHGRPNVHTPTERAPRTGSAGLYKQKKSAKSERF
ncbi:MAG: DEAD/DEAH box helicase [Treponema sp.]|nr:DEAD/DEAH box helicase [Treponema sp.]